MLCDANPPYESRPELRNSVPYNCVLFPRKKLSPALAAKPQGLLSPTKVIVNLMRRVGWRQYSSPYLNIGIANPPTAMNANLSLLPSSRAKRGDLPVNLSLRTSVVTRSVLFRKQSKLLVIHKTNSSKIPSFCFCTHFRLPRPLPNYCLVPQRHFSWQRSRNDRLADTM